MKRVGFVVHAGRAAAISAAAGLAKRVSEAGAITRALLGESVEAQEKAEIDSFPLEVDLVVSVGGDGTFLRAARIAYTRNCPILGVKVGRLGFLTEAEPEEAFAAVKSFLDGDGCIEERMAVVAEPQDAPWTDPEWALNEVIVEKASRHRLIRLGVTVDGHEVTTFSADGVIVATPTGSTAYSFSARGPIVSPALSCLVVTPVAAHMVFDRSIVLARTETVALHVVGEEPALLSADGRASLELPVGAAVRIAAAPRPSLMLRPDAGRSFFTLVREKFGLPGGTREG